MKLKDLRLAWRLLAKEPAYSGVAIFGLAVALAACFLLAGLVRHAWTYNDALLDAGRIVVVKERRTLFPRPDWGESAPPPLAAAAVRRGLAAAATTARSVDLGARVGTRFVKISPSVVDANYLDFFGVPTLAGNAAAALARPDALVLGRREALRLFGTADAIGKVLTIAGQPYVVRAIVGELPENTSPAFDLLLGQGVRDWNPAPATEQQAWFRRAHLYLKPAPGVDPARLGAALERIVATERDARLPPGLREGKIQPLTSIAVTPLSKVFFDPGLRASREGERYGSPAAIAGLALLAVLILLLAASNYVNLAAVRTAARRREIAVRKTLGVTGAGLARQFLAEALLVGASSTLIGAVLAWLAMPLFSDLVGRPLGSSFDAPAWLLLAAAGVGTSLLSGAYPAWLAARVPASSALGGRAGETLQGVHMRRVLTVAQFAAAIGLVAASLAVWWQADYASGVDPGFDPSRQLVLALPGEAGKPGSSAVHAFKAELARLPAVEGTAAMSEAIGRDGMQIVRNVALSGADGSRERLPVEIKAVGASFFRVFGLRPLAGTLFTRDKEEGVVLNARAALALGFASPEAAVGQLIDGDTRVIGIAPDLRYTTLRERPGPIMYQLDEDQPVQVVRVRGGGPGALAAARADIEALWARHFPNDAPDIETASSLFALNYRDDMRQARLLALASLVATALACFGIYVLSSYTVRRRAREIVLRKLHGATPRHIGLLVAREWLLLLGLGAALALAPAWLWSERYLSGFVERAPMGPWPLVFAFGLVAAVALLACGRQALAAMRMAPVLALREQ
jgi:putative ABC transport system permease protein